MRATNVIFEKQVQPTPVRRRLLFGGSSSAGIDKAVEEGSSERMGEMLQSEDLSVDGVAREKYIAVLDQLDGLVATAPPIATGFSVCNDHICSIGAAEYASIVAAEHDEDPETRDLARWLLTRIGGGRGGEILTGRRGFDWVAATFRGVPTMGGTGAQVARVLAAVGTETVLALSDRTATQLDTLDDRLRIVSSDGDLLPPGEIPRSDTTPNDAIFVFQFTQGVILQEASDHSDAVTTQRSTRIILRAPARALDIDDDFAEYVERHHITTVLLSGFQTAEPAAIVRTRAWFAEKFGWMEQRRRLVHFELAEYESFEHARAAVTGFAGLVNSLGMSLSELDQLAPGVDPIDAATQLANELGLDRVSVHADTYAFAVTTGDPDLEEQALRTGCLLAASRAVTGSPVLPRELPPGTTIDPIPETVRRESSDPRYRIVAVPSPYTPAPKVTLGLGDTFVAGMLLALAPR